MLYAFQSPYSDRSHVNYTKVRPADCYTLDVCRTMVAMSHVDSIRNDVYIHIEQDVMTVDSSIHYVLGQHDIISSSLSVEQVVASKALKQLSRRRRKCRLPTERLLYFNVLEQANSKLETQIIYPRMRMKRDVLFDISNLIECPDL
uniref:Uncharacterized protein n=1 Tax=Anopheles maculatus TaxID=74869 RepID=A0A182SN94_9DIPT